MLQYRHSTLLVDHSDHSDHSNHDQILVVVAAVIVLLTAFALHRCLRDTVHYVDDHLYLGSIWCEILHVVCHLPLMLPTQTRLHEFHPCAWKHLTRLN
jgi:hypothetical protein